MRVWVLMLACTIASCGLTATPAKWAIAVESGLRCDMSLAEVESIARRKVDTNELPSFWMTHVIQDKSGTQLDLGFRDGRLKLAQVSWTEQMKRMAYFQRIDLCGTEPPSADTVHPIRNDRR